MSTCGKCGAKGFYRRPAGFNPRWLCYEHWKELDDIYSARNRDGRWDTWGGDGVGP